jgi:hypothetical protein
MLNIREFLVMVFPKLTLSSRLSFVGQQSLNYNRMALFAQIEDQDLF